MARSRPTSAPPLSQLMREGGALLSLHWKSWLPSPVQASDIGGGRAVMVIPGFLSSDYSTVIMRSALTAAGFRVHGWGLGMNMGARADLLDRIDAQLLAAAKEGPVAMVGWSLGGLYAREIAKRRPDRVAKVITLGTPFSGNPRANNAWRLYELFNDHKVDSPPVKVRLGEKPPVPTVALWSRKDGIVAPFSARGRPHECDRSIELDCSHMGFMSEACAIEAVLALLAD